MIDLVETGLDGLDEAMATMACAFDPQFGEAWNAAQLSGILAMPGATLILARAPAPCGFALLRTVVAEVELMLLAVQPPFRGRGIGRVLLSHSIDFARQNGGEHYFLEVRDDNPAISLYRLLGLEQVGTRRGYYRGAHGERRDALTFRLRLR